MQSLQETTDHLFPVSFPGPYEQTVRYTHRCGLKEHPSLEAFKGFKFFNSQWVSGPDEGCEQVRRVQHIALYRIENGTHVHERDVLQHDGPGRDLYG